MEIVIFIAMFILGTILGSFYNVVGYRLPKGQSIISPPSHCPNCNNQLGGLELIPVLSFVFQGGKCKHCKAKISSFYTVFELITGLLFGISALVFGLTPNLIIALTFISMLVIIVVSDYHYMIISDSVLIFFGIVLALEIGLINGIDELLPSLLEAARAFITMFAIKKIGDFIFKKESMGGGDIKLLAVFGLVLGYPVALMSIFVGSLIGLPISLILLKKSNEHIIPFGPFLAAGALVLMLLQFDFNSFMALYGFN